MQPWLIQHNLCQNPVKSHLPLGGGNAWSEGQEHILRLTRSHLVFDLASVRINYCLPCVVPLNETTPVRRVPQEAL